VTRRRVLLDEKIADQLRARLDGLDAFTVEFMGWKGIRNGELVRSAQAAGFAVLVTADRALALGPRDWSPLGCVLVTPHLKPRVLAAGDIGAACRSIRPGQVVVIEA
jgi:hypothetical protein